MPSLIPWAETVHWKSLETHFLIESKHREKEEERVAKDKTVHMEDRTVLLKDCFSLFVQLETNNVVAHMLGWSHFLFYRSL